MAFLRYWRMRLLGWLYKTQLDLELDEELCTHLALETEENLRRGMTPAEAKFAALRQFGGIERSKQHYRELRGLRFFDSFAQDIRFGLRTLRKSPGFTSVAVLTLALGIGANTAIFTLIDAVLLKSLPVKNPEELVVLQWVDPPVAGPSSPQWSRNYDGNSWPEHGREVGTSFSYPAFVQIRTRNDVLSDVFALADLGGALNLIADGEPGLAQGQMASANIFSTLGLRPAAGQFFSEGDDHLGASPACVISHSYWRRRFGADPHIAGKPVILAGVPFAIIGVAPEGFFGLQTGSTVDVWVPISAQPLVYPNLDRNTPLFTSAKHWWVVLVGRLKPGASAIQAAADLNVVFQPVAAEGLVPRYGTPAVLPSLELAPGGAGLGELRRTLSRPLFTLMSLVGGILLITCANVAGLLLARAAARQNEIGVRLSLGAPRGRLIRQLLTESLLLASLGGALGYLLSAWGGDILIALISSGRNPLLLALSPDLRVLGFTAAASGLTALLFGIAPAWHATRLDLTSALKRTALEIQPAQLRLSLGKTLVVFQVALSVVLLFCAGLFVRTLVKLRNLDPGFDKENVLLFGLNPTTSGYKESALNNFYAAVQQLLATLPGVNSATASWHLLLGDGSRSLTVSVPSYTPVRGESMSVHVLPVGPNFFATMKIAVLRGRDFTERDHESAPKVIAVNQAFADRYLASRDPLGQHIILAPNEKDFRSEAEIIALIKDAKYDSLRGATPPTVYQPVRQATHIPFLFFEVRTAGNPLALVPAVRAVVASVDSGVPLFGIKTQSEQIDALLLQERLFARLTSVFGLLAISLACIGLYGLTSYSVSRRTREIGIRMALGAQQTQVLRMVLGETLLMVAAGLILGVLGSLAAGGLASTLIADLLFELRPTDAVTLCFASGLMTIVAAVAGFLPARRAARVDPMVALRDE